MESSGDDAQWAAMRRRHRPDNELPGSVPFDVVIGRTDDLVVAITGARAFTTGLAFTLVVRSRRRRADGLIHDISGHHRPGTDPDRQLLLGFEYADGRRGTNIGSEPVPMPAHADTVTLVTGGGGGDDLAVDYDFYLSPLPPAGDLVVFCAWPALDVPETRTVLDANLVVEAARRAVVLWPEPGPEEREPVAPPRPRPPAGGLVRRDCPKRARQRRRGLNRIGAGRVLLGRGCAQSARSRALEEAHRCVDVWAGSGPWQVWPRRPLSGCIHCRPVLTAAAPRSSR